MPGMGAGAGWWQIDVLHFDEAFFGTLRQISAILAIAGMFALRGWMARRPLPYLVVFLSLYSTVMMMPFIGMFYGLHEWTQATFGFGARTRARLFFSAMRAYRMTSDIQVIYDLQLFS